MFYKFRLGLIPPVLFMVCVLLGVSRMVEAQSVHGSMNNSGYTPQRVFHAKKKQFTDFESMLAELAGADVVFVGEQHDDPATHKLERAILEGLSRRKVRVTVALEMFERDVQPALDDYLAGRMTEEEFLKNSRPWPRYATDYRPLVEFARAHGWHVIAGNSPRRLATKISREGLATVDSLTTEDRGFLAKQLECPTDDYFKRFVETMSGHPGSEKNPEKNKDNEKQDPQQMAMIERFYQAQCAKDETMAESITEYFQTLDQSQQKNVIVHYNGAFHSDFRFGAANRTIRRMPKSKILVVTVIPVDDLDTVRPDEYRKRADYVIFTLKPMKVGG